MTMYREQGNTAGGEYKDTAGGELEHATRELGEGEEFDRWRVCVI